jgi:hypothetical protein
MNTECSTDSRKPTLVPVIAENETTPLCEAAPLCHGQETVAGLGDCATTGNCAKKRQAVAGLSRWQRFDRVTIGFWLGGATLGTGGCILGACTPYHHPVAIAISVTWWGIYLGCLGASLGALFGLFIDKNGRTRWTLDGQVNHETPSNPCLGTDCPQVVLAKENNDVSQHDSEEVTMPRRTEP